MKILKIVLALLFILFAYFQYNDPDPTIWILTYGIAAIACYMSFKNALPTWVYYLLAAGSFIAAALQWPPHFEGILFGEMAMRSMNIELARESLGLIIMAISMGFLGWDSKKQQI